MIKGSIVALITPFTNDLKVDYLRLTNLIHFHLKNKTDALLILGTTSEAHTLSEDEKISIIKHTISIVNKKIPVLVGTGSNDTYETIRFSKRVEQLKVDGLLIVTPYYNKSNIEGLKAHFKAINDSLNTPIYIYNVPSRTGFNLPLEVLKEIMTYSHIKGLKEASGNMSYFAQVMSIVPKSFAVYIGNDDLVIPALSLGASGVISVCANIIPLAFSNMVHYYFKQQIEKAKSLQLYYLDLINSLFIEVNPIPVKYLLYLMGFIHGFYRLPLYMPSESLQLKLKELKKRYQI